MDVNYIAVWKLHGFNSVEGETLRIIASSEDPNARAYITQDPEPYFDHVDRARVISTSLMTGALGKSSSEESDKFVAESIETFREDRKSKTERGAFLVISGKTESNGVGAKAMREFGNFFSCFDAVDKDKIIAEFQEFSNFAIAMAVVETDIRSNQKIELLGSVIYLIEPATSKPIYSFSIRAFSPSVHVVPPLDVEAQQRIVGRASKVLDHKRLRRSVMLLVRSLESERDPLSSFLAAWAAFETFIYKSYARDYAMHISELAGASIRQKFLLLIRKLLVRRERHTNLAERFRTICDSLSPDSAADDEDEFRRLKRIRDKFYHGERTPDEFPIDAVQKLLLKYLRLHFDRDA